jgi:hypothetical protein
MDLLGAKLWLPAVFRTVVDFVAWLLPSFDLEFPQVNPLLFSCLWPHPFRVACCCAARDGLCELPRRSVPQGPGGAPAGHSGRESCMFSHVLAFALLAHCRTALACSAFLGARARSPTRRAHRPPRRKGPASVRKPLSPKKLPLIGALTLCASVCWIRRDCAASARHCGGADCVLPRRKPACRRQGDCPSGCPFLRWMVC